VADDKEPEVEVDPEAPDDDGGWLSGWV